ncbi:unnamed protein product [Spirodela intermedia]|uniref:Uncharacterized protein n=1 Tax=Spirodela intermedia TaxID=51605 RepID=A0A7I8KNQ5_SPIIN|nr:unnamed protein product [Spirodela intermedia]
MDSDMDEHFRRKSSSGRKRSVPGDILYRQLEQYRGRPRAFAGEVVGSLLALSLLITMKLLVSNVLKRHEELKERLSRDTDKMIFDRLQKEFEVARASQTEDQVHMEADRKAMPGQESMPPDPHFLGKITYRVGNKSMVPSPFLFSLKPLECFSDSWWYYLVHTGSHKLDETAPIFKVICCLEGARIGIQYETSFAGEPCEIYHCVLESKSFLEKMTVAEHTIPFFLPVREVENDLLFSNAIKFIDYIGDILQAYVDRREQIRVLKELYGNQIKELYHSLSCNLIEFVVEHPSCGRVTFSLRYGDLGSTTPSRIRVLVWPVSSSPRGSAAEGRGAAAASSSAPPGPTRLSFAEEALRAASLPEGTDPNPTSLPSSSAG